MAEFVGTFFVMFTIGCNAVAGERDWIPTSIAFSVVVAMYATSAVSGGHLNPTVSVALGLCGKMSWSSVLAYVSVQVAAGIVAAFGVTGLLGQTVGVGVHSGFDFVDAAIVEFIFGTSLAFVALSCMVSSPGKLAGEHNQYFALAVGFVTMAGGYCSSDISGAFFSPAATIGFGLSSQSPLSNIAAYVGCQLLAANAAVVLYFMVHPKELEEAVGAAVDGLSVGRACGALACFGVRQRAEEQGDHPDEESGQVQPKVHVYDNYAVQVSARWFAELLGTYVVVLTFVLSSVNQKMSLSGKLDPEAINVTKIAADHLALVQHSVSASTLAIASEDAEAGDADVSIVAWATGAAIVSLVYALGSVSGGHFNPAVTAVAVLSRRPGCTFAEGTSFILAQCGAAIGAALTVCLVHRKGASLFNKDRVLNVGPNAKDGYGWSGVMSGEVVFTAALILVWMCMVTVKSPRYSKASSTKSFQFALATGICYTAGSYAMEDISGGYLNPAVTIGVSASNFVSSGFSGLHTKTLLGYLLAQALGGVVAALVFMVVHPHEYKMDPLLAGQHMAAEGSCEDRERRA